jgi:alpha-galactosidase
MKDEKGQWTVRNDVVLCESYLDANKFKGGRSTPLSATANGKHIGPEIGFGYVMGTFHDEPVLLLESSQGNRSLCFDFRPPSSGRPNPDNNFEGLEYRLMVEGVHKALKNIDKIVPNYAGQGYEIAGFAWFQGHKDSGKSKEEYEKHLVNLIQDLRKEFKVPDMRAVVATVGFGGWGLSDNYKGVHAAQMAVGDPKQHPEFAGTVASVDTRGYWREAGESPSGTGYHYNHNAETYVLVGDSLGRAMVELMGGKAQPGPVPPRPATNADKPVSEMTLQEMATLIHTGAFLSPWSHDEREPTAEQMAAMGPALRPIIFDKMLPDYIAALQGKSDPSILSLITGKKVEGYRPGVKNAYDGVISHYKAAGIDDYSWKRFGGDMQHATWNYYSFDPPEKQPLEQSNRLRPITLPEGMENWFAEDFDAKQAGWKSGPAPFGQKDGKKLPQRPYCKDPDCGCGEIPGTLWEKEVLLMQQTFDFPKVKDGHAYRLIVGGNKHSRTGEGLQIYVNGKKLLETKGGCFRYAKTRGAYILDDFLADLKSGKVTIAVKTFLRYTYFVNVTTYWDKKDTEWTGKPVPPNGNMSLWLEEAKMPEPVLELGKTEQ